MNPSPPEERYIVITLLLLTRARHDARLPRRGAVRSVAELQEGLLQIGAHAQSISWSRTVDGDKPAGLTLAALHETYPELRTL